MPGEGLQEVLTRFGFQFDKTKFAAIERGVKRSVTNLDTITKQTDIFQQRMGSFFARAKQVIGVYLGFRAVKTITSDYANAADAVAKFATATGLSTERYQGLVHAVQLGGSDQENLNKALQQLSKRALEAGQGLKTQQRAFNDLGVSWKDAGGKLKGADQLFLDISDGFVSMTNESKRTGLSMQLLGRTGAKLLPTMLEGSKGIRKMMLEAKKLGIVLSRDQLKAAENFNDEMLRVKSVLTGVRNQIAAKLLPSITKVLKAFQLWWRESNNAERAMRALKITAIFTAAVLAKVVTGKVIKNVTSFVKGIWAGVRALRAMNFQAAIAQIKVLLIFAAFALLALAIEDLIGFAQGKDSVIGRLLGDTSQARDLKAAVIGFGKAAVQAWKDIGPAMLEAWNALVPVIKDLWAALKPIIGPVFRAAIWWIVLSFKGMRDGIKLVSTVVFVLTKAFKGLFSTVAAVFGPIKRLFDTVFGAAKKALEAMGLLTGTPIKAETSITAFTDAAISAEGRLRGTATGQRTDSLADASEFPVRARGVAPGPAVPGLISRLPSVSSQQTVAVAPGAIAVTVVTQASDPTSVAREVNAIVTEKIAETFTDASRDLRPAPAGQR